jgi:hypothetical protein
VYNNPTIYKKYKPVQRIKGKSNPFVFILHNLFEKSPSINHIKTNKAVKEGVILMKGKFGVENGMAKANKHSNTYRILEYILFFIFGYLF